MKEEKYIKVIIVEDEELYKELCEKYFRPGKITCAYSFKEEERERIIKALDLV